MLLPPRRSESRSLGLRPGQAHPRRQLSPGRRRHQGQGHPLQSQADERKGADTAADCLTNKRHYLDSAHALRQGWPIATGVIEAACRHLVKDRMDITGARRSLAGAEPVLRLRALISNGDLETYWSHHLEQEHRRVHGGRYASANAAPHELALAA